MNTRGWCVRACERACEGWSASSVSRHGNRIPFGVTQYWDGNEEARIRPRVFCFTMRAAQVAVAGVGRGWREAEWSGGTYATKRWSTARAITTFPPPPPRDRYKGSIVYPHCPIDKSSGKEIGRFSYTLPLPERGKRQEEEEDNVSRSKR